MGICGLKIVSKGDLGNIRVISNLWRYGLIKIVRFKINLFEVNNQYINYDSRYSEKMFRFLLKSTGPFP